MKSSDVPANSFYFYDCCGRSIKVKTHPFEGLDSQRHYSGGTNSEWRVSRKPFKDPKHTPPFGLRIQIKDNAHQDRVITSLFSAACGAESIVVELPCGQSESYTLYTFPKLDRACSCGHWFVRYEE